MHPSTFSKELVLSLLLSSRLFPESVETKEPLESAWSTELTFGVELWGEAAGTQHKNTVLLHVNKIERITPQCTRSISAGCVFTTDWVTCSRDDTKHIFVKSIFYAAPRFLRSHHAVWHRRVLPHILGKQERIKDTERLMLPWKHSEKWYTQLTLTQKFIIFKDNASLTLARTRT